MDKFGLYVPQLLPFKEHFIPKAHPACMGCGVALGVRQTYKALEEKRDWMNGAGWEIPYKQPLLGNFSKRNIRRTADIKQNAVNLGNTIRI